MSQSRETANIVDELLKLRPGQVQCFLDADFDSVRQNLQGRPADVQRPILLLKRIEKIPTTAHFVSEVLSIMATTARNLWPVWFTDIDFGMGRSAADRAAAQLKIGQLHGHLRGLSRTWGRKALAKAMDGKLPLVLGFPRATQLHQLRLAISRSGLVLVLALAAGKEDVGLASLTNAVLWLARNARLAVAVLLPSEVVNRVALAQIVYNPILCVTTSPAIGITEACGIDIVVDEADDSTTAWLWLGEGRTHPRSAVEAKLAKALRDDVELGLLFSANQCVETIYRNQPIVDLLWAKGRVVVEIDGDDHRDPCKFVADRRRDFELLVSGYSVLRLVNSEVIVDTAKAIEQIRQVVRYRNETASELERLP